MTCGSAETLSHDVPDVKCDGLRQKSVLTLPDEEAKDWQYCTDAHTEF
jgi:hypothetical protein